MADDQTQAAPPDDQQSAILQQMLQQLQAGPPQPQVDTTPVKRGWLSLLGEAIGGGPPVGPSALSPHDRETAGLRALGDFGTGLMAASRYQPGQTVWSNLAGGFQGAEESLGRSQQMAAAQLGAQQDYQQKQQEMQISRLKEMLPLLKMQVGMATPNTLLGGPGKPNTSIGAVGGDGLTGDKAHDLPIIAQRESGGDPTALNYVAKEDPSAYDRGATASGKYQIVNSTWREGMQLAGLDPAQYATARAAPVEVQDKVAGALFDKYGNKPWQKGSKDWVKDESGQYQLATVRPPAAAPGSPAATPAVTAASKPPAASSAQAAAPAVPGGGGPLTPPGAPQPSPTGAIAQATRDAEVGPQPLPATAGKGTPLPAGNLQTTGKPPGVASNAEAIQAGVNLAQATPVVPGTGLAAGPPGIGQPATLASVVPGGGSSFAPTAPPAVAAPQPATQGQQPPPVTQPITAPAPPPGGLTFEQFQQQHPLVIPDEERKTWTVPPPDLTDALAAKAEAARQLSLARAGISGDPNKSLSDYNTAAQNVAKLQQDAQTKSLEMQQASLQHARDTQRQLYDAEMQRQAAAAEAQRQRDAAVALKTQEGQQAIDLEKVKAGQTWRQKLQEQAATDAQENTIKPMAAASMKAHQMNLGLEQMLPVLKDLPSGGGPVGALVEAHPDLVPLLRFAGVLDSKETDAIRLINGLVSNISTEMKPQGLGALREYEWDAFKSQLPGLLSTEDGQLKAVAMLMNMNNRIQDEHSWMHNYFNRKIPDETNPSQMVRAHNLESDNPKESVQQRMDRELGPIIPRFSGPLTASGQAQWEQSLPPGKPYYKTWAEKDPQTGQAARRSDGSLKTHTTLEVRPWQQ